MRATKATLQLGAGFGAALCVALGLAGGWLLRAHSAADRAAVEGIVHTYLLAHPEILPEAMESLRAKESAAALAPIKAKIAEPWPGAVLGNPRGRVTLVEFSDYACGYCRASQADVAALIAANPDLRVVVRELPILTPASGEAAKLALRAARAGRYVAFRAAMYAAGSPSHATIAAAAASAGIDPPRHTADDAAILAELTRNIDYARQLGVTGTPVWVIGDQMLTGAVGQAALARAIAAARG